MGSYFLSGRRFIRRRSALRTLLTAILVAAFARLVGGKPVGERRIVLGAVAYAVPYAAMWSLVGLVVSGALGAAF